MVARDVLSVEIEVRFLTLEPTLRCRLTVGPLTLNQETAVRNLPPEPTLDIFMISPHMHVSERKPEQA